MLVAGTLFLVVKERTQFKGEPLAPWRKKKKRYLINAGSKAISAAHSLVLNPVVPVGFPLLVRKAWL